MTATSHIEDVKSCTEAAIDHAVAKTAQVVAVTSCAEAVIASTRPFESATTDVEICKVLLI